MSWKMPVRDTLFVSAYGMDLLGQRKDKPTAMGTRFRYSDALACSRRLVFTALGVPVSDPIDVAGMHVTTAGTWRHEQFQAAVGKRYPGARFEVVSTLGPTSGSADGVVTAVWQGREEKVLIELKTVGAYAFDKAVGINRKAYKATDPEGPRPSAVAQGALNALATDCQTLVIVYLTNECISKGLAEKLSLSQWERLGAEWHIPSEIWRPMAEAEVARIEQLASCADNHVIPGGDAWENDEWKSISPNDNRQHWTCQYCPYLSACLAHEAGIEVI